MSSGNTRRAHKLKRIVSVKLPDGDTRQAISGRNAFTHAVIVQKSVHREPGYAPCGWYVKSWHGSKDRAKTVAAAVDRERRTDWAKGRPINREARWAEVRVVPVRVELEQAWAK